MEKKMQKKWGILLSIVLTTHIYVFSSEDGLGQDPTQIIYALRQDIRHQKDLCLQLEIENAALNQEILDFKETAKKSSSCKQGVESLVQSQSEKEVLLHKSVSDLTGKLQACEVLSKQREQKGFDLQNESIYLQSILAELNQALEENGKLIDLTEKLKHEKNDLMKEFRSLNDSVVRMLKPNPDERFFAPIGSDDSARQDFGQKTLTLDDGAAGKSLAKEYNTFESVSLHSASQEELVELLADALGPDKSALMDQERYDEEDFFFVGDAPRDVLKNFHKVLIKLEEQGDGLRHEDIVSAFASLLGYGSVQKESSSLRRAKEIAGGIKQLVSKKLAK